MTTRPLPLPIPLALAGVLLLGGGCVYTRAAVDPSPVPDFYTFGPPVEIYWSYGCALPDCGYPTRWAGNRWVYWTGSYWAYDEGGRVYAWTHVRSRPAGVRYTRPRNVVTVDPYRVPRYPPPVQRPPPYRPQPAPYTPAPSQPGVQRPKPYQPAPSGNVPPPNTQRPKPYQPSKDEAPPPTPR